MKEEKLSLETIHTKKVDDLSVSKIKSYLLADRQAVSKHIDPADPKRTNAILTRKIREYDDLIELLSNLADDLKYIKKGFEDKIDEEYKA